MNNQLIKASEYTPDQIALIKSQIAPKANKDELAYFMQQCLRTQLDPFSKQIYAIHRWNSQQGKEVMSIQVSIDGFRVIAQRSELYAGQGEPEYLEKDNKLDCCKVRVYKFSPKGERYEAAVGVAYWNEYVQTTKDGKPSGLWAKMPHVMLAKVAEAVALRKAFPHDLSGLYTSEEMQQADTPTVETNYTEIKEELKEEIDNSDRALLFVLLSSSTLTEGTEEYRKAWNWIDTCPNYKKYEKIKARLEELQPSIHEIQNPSQKDINQHLKAVQS
jgi:phage recombination protein Bet